MSLPTPEELNRREVLALEFDVQNVVDLMASEQNLHEETKRILKLMEARRQELQGTLDEKNRAHRVAVKMLNFQLGDLMAETKQLEEIAELRRGKGPDPKIVRKAVRDAEASFAGEIGKWKKVVASWKKRAGKKTKASSPTPDSIPTDSDSDSFMPSCDSLDYSPRSRRGPSGSGSSPEPVRRRPVKRKALLNPAKLNAIFDVEPSSSDEEPSTPKKIQKPVTWKQGSREKRKMFTALSRAVRTWSPI